MFDESRFPRHPRVTLAQCHCVARRMEAARPPLQRLPTDTAGTKPGRPREEYGCSLTILCPDVEDGGAHLRRTGCMKLWRMFSTSLGLEKVTVSVRLPPGVASPNRKKPQ